MAHFDSSILLIGPLIRLLTSPAMCCLPIGSLPTILSSNHYDIIICRDDVNICNADISARSPSMGHACKNFGCFSTNSIGHNSLIQCQIEVSFTLLDLEWWSLRFKIGFTTFWGILNFGRLGSSYVSLIYPKLAL